MYILGVAERGENNNNFEQGWHLHFGGFSNNLFKKEVLLVIHLNLIKKLQLHCSDT